MVYSLFKSRAASLKTLPFIVLGALLLWMSSGHTRVSESFTDFDGQPRAVSDYLSPEKWTIVMIWRHNCHVCNEEAAGYAFFHDGNERAQVLGLSMDGQSDKDGAQAFIDNHDLSFTNLIGEPRAVASYFQGMTGQRFRGTPSFLVFAPGGRLMAAQVGAVPPDTIQAFIDSQGKNQPTGQDAGSAPARYPAASR